MRTRRALLTAAGGRRGSGTPGDQLSSFRLVPEAFPITIFETTRPFQEKGKKKMQLSDIPRNPRRRNAENQMCWSPSSRDSREINDFTC